MLPPAPAAIGNWPPEFVLMQELAHGWRVGMVLNQPGRPLHHICPAHCDQLENAERLAGLLSQACKLPIVRAGRPVK